ncbi:R3HDM4 [Bugula neritina]|uniref:R3HDM4 n=1 Tax=Bugula neritina TaxID=10212 RepID=A0A7J7J1A9_BUGNE|nr:R3HDM4 [Bugula neritina]
MSFSVLLAYILIMGIHDRVDPHNRVIQISDLQPDQAFAGNYTSDDASSVASEQPPLSRPPRRSRTGRAQAIDYQSFAERLHLSMVKALVGLEESEIENDFVWTPENYGKSIFSSLFAESEKMKVWNNFIELNEDDQNLLMETAASTVENAEASVDIHNAMLTKGQAVTADPSHDDKRSAHPSYSSEKCFQQINQNLKNLLKKRHVPLGLLESLEIEIRANFIEEPLSIYTATMESSFGRLFVHAVSQYLGLDSMSFDHGETRLVTVVNKATTFNPPLQLLHEYLEHKSGRQPLFL